MKKSLSILLPFIEDFINRVLRLDRETLERLGELDGKVIGFRYQLQDDLSHTIYMMPFAGGLRLQIANEEDVAADVTISGNLPAFIGLALGEASASNMAKADMQIKGDIKLGQKFKEITEKIDLDVAGHLGKIVGEAPAQGIDLLFHRWQSWKSNTAKTFARDFAEFILEERKLSPRKEEVDVLLDGVDDLRSGVDRLARRLADLKEKSAT